MRINITFDEGDLKRLVRAEIIRITGFEHFADKDIKIETKSTQNRKAEWESGAGFRVTLDKSWNE
jgi:hypothetical protein